MREVSLGSPAGPNDMRFVYQALSEFSRASFEGLPAVIRDYGHTGTLVETRTIDLDTPSAANVAAVLATLIRDLQSRGASRRTL